MISFPPPHKVLQIYSTSSFILYLGRKSATPHPKFCPIDQVQNKDIAGVSKFKIAQGAKIQEDKIFIKNRFSLQFMIPIGW